MPTINQSINHTIYDNMRHYLHQANGCSPLTGLYFKRVDQNKPDSLLKWNVKIFSFQKDAMINPRINNTIKIYLLSNISLKQT